MSEADRSKRLNVPRTPAPAAAPALLLSALSAVPKTGDRLRVTRESNTSVLLVLPCALLPGLVGDCERTGKSPAGDENHLDVVRGANLPRRLLGVAPPAAAGCCCEGDAACWRICAWRMESHLKLARVMRLLSWS